MGTACNNAPETRNRPLCDDGLHFAHDAYATLLDMWEKAVVETERRSSDRPLMHKRSATATVDDLPIAGKPIALIPWPMKLTPAAATLVGNRAQATYYPPMRAPQPPVCNFKMDGPHEFTHGPNVMSVNFYDSILDKYAREGNMPNDDPAKHDLLPLLQIFETLHAGVPMGHMQPLVHQRPTVFLLTSGEPQCKDTAMDTATMIRCLGWDVSYRATQAR